MPTTTPLNTQENKETLDDNARKFIVDALDQSFLTENRASSFTLLVDWLETSVDNEKKIVHKTFDNGDVRMFLVSKVTKDSKRVAEKEKIDEQQYKALLPSSTLHLEKKRHEFDYIQNNISFSVKYDEFAGSDLRMIEVDASSDAERNSFNPSDFPATLVEVTGEIKYYGYRMAKYLKTLS